MHKIRFESENYYFYLNNLSIKNEYNTKDGIAEIVKVLGETFEFRLIRISRVRSGAEDELIYGYNYSKLLPPDLEETGMHYFKAKIISGQDYFFECVLYSTKAEEYRMNHMQISKKYDEVIKKYFNTIYDKPIDRFELYESGGGMSEAKKRKKKHKYSGQFGMPHQNAYGSEIEKKLGEKLPEEKFKRQHEIFYQGKLFTIPDFYVDDPKLLIYCDGFQYHYDRETVIKDRQQDRMLQMMGFKVLRYTGSEIVGKLDECVFEINEFVRIFESKKS